MLMIISIFSIAFPQHGHWRSCTVCFYVTNLQLLISFFSIKLHFLLRLEIDRWILRCCQSIISAKCCQHIVYWQYLLIKATTLFFCMECSETQVATACMINWRKLCTVPYDAQISDCIKQCAIFRPLRNHPNKPVYDVTFAPRFCAVGRWLPANKAVIFDYFSDPGWRRIPCYTLLHCTEALSFNCGLSVAKYRHRQWKI